MCKLLLNAHTKHMRKITRESIEAFENNQDFDKQNTSVSNGGLFLHGNKIAEFESLLTDDGNRNVNITLADWNTVTTRERLNGIEGVRISVRKGVTYLNDKEWDGEWITVQR